MSPGSVQDSQRPLNPQVLWDVLVRLEPHRNFDDPVNGNLIRAEIEGGVHLRDVPPGAVLVVETQNRRYTIVKTGDAKVWISGHPFFCPDPVLVTIHGSTWGGTMLCEHYIGRGMHLEFGHPDFPAVTTSRIVDVQQKEEQSIPVPETTNL